MTSGASFGAYLHVPFCAKRCGYCDFNTYTSAELGDPAPGTTVESFPAAIGAEFRLAADALVQSGWGQPRVDTIFVGGGTPTLLSAAALTGVLADFYSHFAVKPDAEVTVEANPDTLSAEYCAQLAAGGVTRVSVGMQSAVPHVLGTLDRTHNPDNVSAAIYAAQSAGLQVSVDLIYGTPGESVADWRESLEAAVALNPDHVSAYALTVESGTAMHRLVRRGDLPNPNHDDQAAKYEIADELLHAAGFTWYEISNWSKSADTRCRHNIGYWNGGSWWGFGPGAHGYLAGRESSPPRRWWNVKLPRKYGALVHAGQLPEGGAEELTGEDVQVEQVMLGIRLADGLCEELAPAADRIPGLVEAGLVTRSEGRLMLTSRGRLVADHVTRQLLGW